MIGRRRMERRPIAGRDTTGGNMNSDYDLTKCGSCVALGAQLDSVREVLGEERMNSAGGVHYEAVETLIAERDAAYERGCADERKAVLDYLDKSSRHHMRSGNVTSDEESQDRSFGGMEALNDRWADIKSARHIETEQDCTEPTRIKLGSITTKEGQNNGNL